MAATVCATVCPQSNTTIPIAAESIFGVCAAKQLATTCPVCTDTWARQFVVRDMPGKKGEREVAGVDWIFNSWGGKLGGCYDPWCAPCRPGWTSGQSFGRGLCFYGVM